jgi:glutamine phosphoribosylpyrophosphate amidotransferase
MLFLKQLINLTHKGNLVNAKTKADEMINEQYQVINIDDYNIMKEYQRYCGKRIEKKLVRKQMQ